MVVVVARLRAPDADLALSGRKSGEPWEVRVALDEAAPGPGSEKLWARKRIESLMDSLVEGADADRVRSEVIALGLRHHLVSKFTSLVAVDVTPSVPAGVTPAPRRLPVNLPAGWSYERVFGALPGTATPAPLWRLLGWMALFGAAGLRLAGPRRAS